MTGQIWFSALEVMAIENDLFTDNLYNTAIEVNSRKERRTDFVYD